MSVGGDHRLRAGGSFSAITLMGLWRWICRGANNFISASLWLADPAPRSRGVLWMGVTAHPTAEWVASQLPEACGWDQAPTYLLRDRDRVNGQAFTRGIRAMGIRDRPTWPRSPWQKSLCRTADRLDPTEMRRSYRGLRRAAPSSRVGRYARRDYASAERHSRGQFPRSVQL
jgi:hypothetical protein